MNNSAKPCVWQHPLLRSPRAARMRPTFDPPPALCLQNCLGTTAYDIGNVFRQEVSKRILGWGFFSKGAHWILFFLWHVHCFRAYPVLVESWNLSLWISRSGKGSTVEQSLRCWDPPSPLAGVGDARSGSSTAACRSPLPAGSQQPCLHRHHWGAAPAVLHRQGNRGQLPAKRLCRCHLPSARRWVRMEKCSGTEQLLERWAGWVTRHILQIL